MDISIVERDPATVEYCKSNFEIRKVYGSLDEALQSDAEIIDLVVPHHLHRELAVKSMRKGKNVLIEKPIATTLEDAHAMRAEAAESGVKFMVAEQYFFDPYLRAAISAVKSGAAGRVHTIIVRDQRAYYRNSWRTEKKAMGGGALIDGGVHFIETLLDLGGDYDSVTGRSIRGSSAIEGEDTTHALFRFSSGSTGIFYYSWAYNSPPSLPAFEVIGESGSVYEDFTESSKDESANRMNTAYRGLIVNGRKSEVSRYDVFEREIEEFASSVEQGTDVPYPVENAVRNLRAVLDIYSR